MLSKGVFAQVSAVYTVTPQQFFSHYYLLNPANTRVEDRFRLVAGNRSMVGVFSGVGVSYGDIQYTNYNPRATQANTFGVSVTNMRRGDYIQLNKIAIRYGRSSALSESVYISAGISAGVVNYRLGASQASAGGSDLGPDLSAGISAFSTRFLIGVSVMQILNTGLQPINERLELKRYMNFISSYIVTLSPVSDFKFHGWYRYKPRESIPGLMISTRYVWKETLSIGPGYDLERGWFVYAGLSKVGIGEGSLEAGFSFLLVSTRQLSDLTDSIVEISVGYSMERK